MTKLSEAQAAALLKATEHGEVTRKQVGLGTLRALERRGFLKLYSWWMVGDYHHFTYKITPAGRKALEERHD